MVGVVKVTRGSVRILYFLVELIFVSTSCQFFNFYNTQTHPFLISSVTYGLVSNIVSIPFGFCIIQSVKLVSTVSRACYFSNFLLLFGLASMIWLWIVFPSVRIHYLSVEMALKVELDAFRAYRTHFQTCLNFICRTTRT